VGLGPVREPWIATGERIPKKFLNSECCGGDSPQNRKTLTLRTPKGRKAQCSNFLFGDDFDRADRRIVDGWIEVDFDFALGRGFNVLE